MGVSRRLGRLAACFALCASPAGVLAREQPLIMLPASAWVIDRAEDSCAVRRAFQAGEDQVLLEFRQFGPGIGFQVTLVSTTLSHTTPSGISRRPRVRFEPDDDFLEMQGALLFERDDAHGILYSDSLRPNALKGTPNLPEWPDVEREAREIAITGLSVADGFNQDIMLRTGRLFAPMADLRDCTDELLERWGMDADIQRTATRSPEPVDMESWVRRIQSRYPAKQLMAGQSGLAMIRLIVGADGRPASCIPNKDAADHDFDEVACETMMSYARFEPALDANHVPTKGFWSATINYRINP